MDRTWASSLKLRDSSKPLIVGMPKYLPGLVINTFDRQYTVMPNGEWRITQFLPEPHEFPAIVRDKRHISEYHKDFTWTTN